MTERKKGEHHNFYGFGISDKLMKALDELKISKPTPIQAKSIPLAIQGSDIVGIAQTGTGKTFAFGIPMIERLLKEKGTGLIILPTRELALQVEESLSDVGRKLGLKTAVLIGGSSMNWQLNSIKRNPHIIIGTPGRLLDHFERKTINTNNLKFLVLDEADLMLDMGFIDQIQAIVKKCPKDRQTMLFSATMPSQIMRLATRYMKTPIHVEVAPSGTAAENVTHEMVVIHKDDKLEEIEKILLVFTGSVLIFTRTKHGAKVLSGKINEMRHSSVDIHSDKNLTQRKHALAGFKNGNYRIMVATDVAARGIDVKDIELVVNYDLPETEEDYVHRIGRTGRAGQKGKAISFALPNQRKWIEKIEELINQKIPLTKLVEFTGGPTKKKTIKKKKASPLGFTPRRGAGRNVVSQKLKIGKRARTTKPKKSKPKKKNKNW